MERSLSPRLYTWKENTRRKPLIINGARQVGKTWLLKDFGSRAFDSVAYINLDNNPALAAEFDKGYDLQRLLLAMQLQSNVVIRPGRTLLILDEIQECPKALTSLKYFSEQMPDLAVACAGSLLGITRHSGTGYPVGKVDTMDLGPLTFGEYLTAMGRPMMNDLITGSDTSMMTTFSEDLVAHLRNYYFVGGMPEAVALFAEEQDYHAVREIQRTILEGYERDISKHLSASETEAAIAVWKSIPSHLSQENKRFVFGHVRKGGRAREFETSITWLEQAGLVVKVPRIGKPDFPLSAYADTSIFKLFAVDVGLVGAMAGLEARIIIEGSRIFEEFKGALTEQYVCQELVNACGLKPGYWKAANAQSEIDFLVERGRAMYAIEVKAAENLRAKSLRVFHEKYPYTSAVRFSIAPWRAEEWLVNVPLYAVANERLWAGSVD